MSKPALLYSPDPIFYDTNGEILESGTLTFYQAGTVTPTDTFTTSALSVANANPLHLGTDGRPRDSAGSGNIVDVFITRAVKIVAKDSTGATVWTKDNITSLGQIWSTTSKTADYTAAKSDENTAVLVDATNNAITVTLLAANTAGSGYEITIKKTDSTTNRVVVDGNGSETIDGSATYVLHHQNESITIRCDGSNWWILNNQLVITSFRATATNSEIATGASFTKVVFDTETFDYGAYFTSSRYTPLVGGVYQVQASLYDSGTVDDGENITLAIYKNGSLYSSVVGINATDNAGISVQIADLVALNGSTDYIEAFVTHDDSGDVDVDVVFSAFLVG